MKADEPKLLRVSRAAHEWGLHPFTVRKWIKAGEIQAIRVGNEARMPRSEIERLAGRRDGRLLVLYGRVSGQGQKSGLDTQLERLQAWAKVERAGKETLVLSDIGSGLSATRRHLQRLLRLVREDQVAEIVVTYPDRLTRFGQDYLQAFFERFGVTLTVLDPGEDTTAEQEKIPPPNRRRYHRRTGEDTTAEQKLVDDMLAMLASFSGRLYGMRSHKQMDLLECVRAVLNNP